jgi:GNAT superfamily N-acetyltransferase
LLHVTHATRPHPKIRLHQAEPGDFDALVEMLAEMARSLSMERRLWITRADIPDRAARLDRLRGALFGDRPLIEALILEVEAQPAGFCTFHTSFSTFRGQTGLFLEDLFVRESLQKQGLGGHLMARLAAIARKRDCYRIVWHVPADDHALQRFYRNLGARDVEEGTMILDAQPLERLARSAADRT